MLNAANTKHIKECNCLRQCKVLSADFKFGVDKHSDALQLFYLVAILQPEILVASFQLLQVSNSVRSV